MKYYMGQSLFKFSWEQVTQAFWQKYPNPYSTHVLSEDTVERRLQGGCLHSKRIITKTNKLPKWGERFIPGSKRSLCVLEESIIDPKARTMVTYTRNLGLTTIMTVEERCEYRPSSDNSKWTECKREAWISSQVYGFSYALQAFGLDRFKKNGHKAIAGFEHILSRMYLPETIPELPSKLHVNMKAEKFKESAKKAKELAKSKAAAVIVTN